MSLAEVIGQLRDRLTWRDAYGVGIVFSRNSGFDHVLRVIEQNLMSLHGAVHGSFTQRGRNHFVARFTLPGDIATQVEIHVVVYNLFTARPAKRTLSS